MTSTAAEKTPFSVLIVDDEEINRALLKDRLEEMKDWTVRVHAVADGESAMKAMTTAFYDLVMLDYRMPGQDGLAVLEMISQLHSKSAVVMMTNAGNEQVAVQAMKKGALDYVVREALESMDLGHLFRRVIDRRGLLNQNMELRQVNQMKNEFIANVSHELRTPLTVIIGYAKTLQEGSLGPLNDMQRKAIDAVATRSEGLLGTLNQILRVREAFEGRQQVLLKPTDLRAFLAERAARPPKELVRKRQTLKTLLGDEEVWVLADPEKIGEALDNLLSNAMKFGPEGKPITLALARANGSAVVSVMDEGPGIPPELLPHIFEHFSSSVRGLTREQPGLGLGLVLSKQIVELHSGRLWLESRGPGQGCVASFSLPVSGKGSSEVFVERPAKFEKKRVLIVEDNPDLIDVLMLFMAGISGNLEISTARSGLEALESVRDHTPHLIIMDVMMPGMDGFEVIERLRRVPETDRIPVLVLTGYSDALRRAKEVGAHDVMLKPFEKNVFINKVIHLLQQGSGR